MTSETEIITNKNEPIQHAHTIMTPPPRPEDVWVRVVESLCRAGYVQNHERSISAGHIANILAEEYMRAFPHTRSL